MKFAAAVGIYLAVMIVTYGIAYRDETEFCRGPEAISREVCLNFVGANAYGSAVAWPMYWSRRVFEK